MIVSSHTTPRSENKESELSQQSRKTKRLQQRTNKFTDGCYPHTAILWTKGSDWRKFVT